MMEVEHFHQFLKAENLLIILWAPSQKRKGKTVPVITFRQFGGDEGSPFGLSLIHI